MCATACGAKCLSWQSDAGDASALAGLHDTKSCCYHPAEHDDSHRAASLLWFQCRLRAVRKLVRGAQRIPQPSTTALSQARAATLSTASSLRSYAHQVATAHFSLNGPLTRQSHDNLVAAARFRSAACDAQPQPAPDSASLSPARDFASCICPYCNTTPCNIPHKPSLSLSQPAAAAHPSPSRHASYCHPPPPPSASSPLFANPRPLT